MFRPPTIASALVCTFFVGCAITTTYGVAPKQDPLKKNMYAFTVFYNVYSTQYDVDQKAKQLIAEFMEEHSFQFYHVVNVSGGRPGDKMVYEVEFSNQPFKAEYQMPDTSEPSRRQEQEPIIVTGTGFIVADGGYIMTCAHVVSGAKKISVRTLKGAEFPASIVLKDDDSDWCLLHAPAVSTRPIPYTPPQTIAVGMNLFNMAYPLTPILQHLSPVAGAGHLAALQGLGGNPKHMQISVPINPGSSGSPVLDEFGNWVGLASHRLGDLYSLTTTGAIPQGVNFCVKASFIADLLRSSKIIDLPEGSTNTKMSLEETVRVLSPSIVAINAVHQSNQ